MLLLLTRQCRASVRYSLDHLSLGSCGLGSCAGCVGVITSYDARPDLHRRGYQRRAGRISTCAPLARPVASWRPCVKLLREGGACVCVRERGREWGGATTTAATTTAP